MRYVFAFVISLVIFMASSFTSTEAASNSIVYLPLDNRPVSLQLPQMLAEVAGVDLIMPPPDLLGSYLQAGDSDALGAWLLDHAQSSDRFVISCDMLGYGSLVASRLPGVHRSRVVHRLHTLAVLRHRSPGSEIDAFGTVMRLAPTGVPAIGAAARYFASGEASVDLTAFANLPSPQRTEADREVAGTLRSRLGPTLDAYLQARRRNVQVDAYLIDQAANGTLDRLVLGQDDAGPVGVHLADIATLRSRVSAAHLTGDQASIESGTDELGMVLLARASAHEIRWAPRISVTYSRAGARSVHDHIEYEPIDPTITKLIHLSGGLRVAVNERPDINLFVYVAGTSQAERNAFLATMHVLTQSGQHVTIADVSFINGSLADQSELIKALLDTHTATQIDGFASWNTDANSVGTALAAAIFRGVGIRTHHYNDVAHATFLLNRYADDYAYRLLVRSRLTGVLHQEGLAQTYLLPGSAVRMESDARALLWAHIVTLRKQLFPDLSLCRATITLPWQRTFEMRLDMRLAPQPNSVETVLDERRSCRS